jgi:threonine synthase
MPLPLLPETDTFMPDMPTDSMADASRELTLPSLHQELIARRELLKDPAASLEDRLEAFEDIMDSEVGDTSLVRARHLEREFGLRQLYLKFEGGNPTGTQKDRIAFSQCMDALRRGYEVITVATCGNYGVAIALAASLAGLKSMIHVPEAFHTKRIAEMKALGAEIIRVPGDYETTVEASQQAAQQFDWYDGNPGGHNTVLQLQAYGEIAFEIYDELRDAPKVVAVPVSNGTVLAGVHKGFLRLFRRGKTSRLPQMVAGSALKKNPITQALLHHRDTCVDLRPADIHETEVNEPLINWHSFDGEWALDAVRETKGWAGEVSDRRMLQLSRMLRDKEGLQVLPAATAGLAALIEQHQHTALPGDRYVAVLTARKQ